MSFKRILGGILCASMVMSMAFTGCSNDQGSSSAEPSSSGEESSVSSKSESSAGEAVTLQVIIDADAMGIMEPATQILEENTGIKSEIITQSYDQTYNKIMTSVMGGTPIDVIICDSPWTAEFASKGILRCIDDYVSDELKADIFPAYLDQVSYEGKLYAMPQTAQAKWLYYNKDMLTEAGYNNPPATWTELFEMGDKMVEQGLCKYDIAWAAVQAEGLVCDWLVVTEASGASLQDDSGNWAFNNADAASGLSLIVDSIKDGRADPGSINYTDREVLNPFMAGDIPFVLNWSFAYAMAKDPETSQIADSVAVGLVPSNKEGVTSATATGSGGYGIAATSEHPDEAYQLLETVNSKECIMITGETGSNPPPIMSMYDDEDFKEKYPMFVDFYPQLQYGVARPVLTAYSEWSNKMQLGLHEAVTGSKDVETVLNELAEQSAGY